MIDDGVAAAALKHQLVGHEIFVADVERRSHDTAHVHLRRGREQNAVGIDKENLAIRIDRTLNGRDIATHHTVEGHRAG